MTRGNKRPATTVMRYLLLLATTVMRDLLIVATTLMLILNASVHRYIGQFPLEGN